MASDLRSGTSPALSSSAKPNNTWSNSYNNRPVYSVAVPTRILGFPIYHTSPRCVTSPSTIRSISSEESLNMSMIDSDEPDLSNKSNSLLNRNGRAKKSKLSKGTRDDGLTRRGNSRNQGETNHDGKKRETATAGTPVGPASLMPPGSSRKGSEKSEKSKSKKLNALKSPPSSESSPLSSEKQEAARSEDGWNVTNSALSSARDEDDAIEALERSLTIFSDDEASPKTRISLEEVASSSSSQYPDLEPLPGDAAAMRPSILSATTDGRMASPSLHSSTTPADDEFSEEEEALGEDEWRGGKNQPSLFTVSPFSVDSDTAYQIRILRARKKTVTRLDKAQKSKYSKSLFDEARSARTFSVSSRSSQPSRKQSIPKRPSEVSTRKEELSTSTELLEGQESPYSSELRTVILSCDNIRIARSTMWPLSSMEEVFELCESTFEFLEPGKYEVECHHIKPSRKNPWMTNEGEKQISLEIYFDTSNGIASLYELVTYFEIPQLITLFQDGLGDGNMELLKAVLIECVRRFSEVTEDNGPIATAAEKSRLLDCLVSHIDKLAAIPERIFTDALQTIYAALENLKFQELEESIDCDQFFVLCLRGFTIRKNSPFHANIFQSACDVMLLLCSMGGNPETIVQGPAFDTILEQAFNLDSVNLAHGTTACEALKMLAGQQRGLERVLEKWETISHWLVETLVMLESPIEAPEWVVPALQVALFRLWGIMAYSLKECRTAFLKNLEVPRRIVALLSQADAGVDESDHEEADVVAAACHAIAATLMDPDSRHHMKKEFHQNIITVLQTYGEDEDVLDNAYRCLGLSVDRYFLQKSSGTLIPMMMSHLKRHQDNLNLVTNGFHTLGIIFRREPSSVNLCTEEILQEFVRILKEHPFNEELQAIGMYLIGTCATDSERNRLNLVKSGAVQLCKLASGQFPDNEELKEITDYTNSVLSKEAGWRFW